MKLKSENLLRNLVLALCFAASESNFSSAPAVDYLQEGERLYKAGNYTDAGRYFQGQIKATPGNATAHYLLGNVYVALRRSEDAAAEYSRACSLDINGKVGRYSALALTNLKKQTIDSRSNEPSNVPQSSSAADGTEEAESNNTAELNIKLSQINKETDRKIKAIQIEMNDAIAQNGPPLYMVRDVMGIPTSSMYYDPEPKNAQVREKYGFMIDKLKQEGQKRIDEATLAHRQKSASIQEHAANVSRQSMHPIRRETITLPIFPPPRPARVNPTPAVVKTGSKPRAQAQPVVSSPVKTPQPRIIEVQ